MATKKGKDGAGKDKEPKKPKQGKRWQRQKAKPANLTAAKNRAKAMELRLLGHTFTEIAQTLKVTDGRAHQYVTEALRELAALRLENAEAYRDIELAKLDALEVKANALLDSADTQANVLSVMNMLLKIMERRAKLLALDAPTKVQAALSGPDGGPLAHGVLIVPAPLGLDEWQVEVQKTLECQRRLQKEHEAELTALVPKGSGPNPA